MGEFYFDESIHTRGHFVLGAFVYSEQSLHEPVADALSESGLSPQIDEFKSGARMERNATQKRARDLLQSLIYKHCRIGLVVAPHIRDHSLGGHALLGLDKILSSNSFKSGSHQVFFDEGIFKSISSANKEIHVVRKSAECIFHFEQNSREVLGLQVADLVAHTCATMLLCELGLVKKMVKAGENSGYDPEADMELEFKLWGSLRNNFFAAAPPPLRTWNSQLDFQVDVASRGLYIAETCEDAVKTAALNRFGSMYLGCIH